MDKFGFSYEDSLKRIRCIYTFNDVVDSTTTWEGYILAENVDGLLNIEGYEQDKMSPKEKNGDPHYRFLSGTRAISYADDSLIFQVYPGVMCPIEYNMRYNKEDGCFYGTWFFVPFTDKHPSYYNNPCYKSGKAIIWIEDVPEKDIDGKTIETIRRLGKDYKKDYAEEIEFFYNQAFSRFISDNQVNQGAVKRLSMYSDSVKSH